MKKQIKRLIQLAEMYAEKCAEFNFPQTHNYLQDGDGKQIEVRVYLSDNNSTMASYFDKVEVALYSNKITLPFHADENYLTDLIVKVEDFFNSYSWEDRKKESDELKQLKIADLEKQLEKLKNS